MPFGIEDRKILPLINVFISLLWLLLLHLSLHLSQHLLHST